MQNKKSCFITESGMIRIRWWPLMLLGIYLTYNSLVLALLIMSSDAELVPGWRPDPILNAPLIWLFGQ